MTDLEGRLAAALDTGAAEAPSAAGLAEGARRRLRARRRTRAVVGGVLAVLLVAVPGGVLLARDDGSASPVDGIAADGWRTVTHDGIEVEAPADWEWLDTSGCQDDRDRMGAPDTNRCRPDRALSFYRSATFDPLLMPGLHAPTAERPGPWTGYVYAGDWVIHVSAPDQDVAWRVLASARVAGEGVPDLARGSVELVEHGLRATVPVDGSNWSLRSTPRPGPRYPTVRSQDGRWNGRAGLPGGAMVVETGTQALAQLVAGSVGPAGVRTETWRDLTLEVPDEWGVGDTCGNTGPPVVTRADNVSCPGLTGYGVRLAPYPRAATLAVTDRMQRAEGPNWPEGSWKAIVQAPGSSTVAIVVIEDRVMGQRIIDSVRRAGRSDRQ
ncbi:hypothetical protein [Nocardioides sp. W7]|uniref:hypothetical protein n=1 Tax=Nocardioides sp. W7 TaxID=2931390 RepID=UPI001FD357B2|nr:hypothetical protein [Nocardioides sp. W7]